MLTYLSFIIVIIYFFFELSLKITIFNTFVITYLLIISSYYHIKLTYFYTFIFIFIDHLQNLISILLPYDISILN